MATYIQFTLSLIVPSIYVDEQAVGFASDSDILKVAVQ
jgi:hypothetical protein